MISFPGCVQLALELKTLQEPIVSILLRAHYHMKRLVLADHLAKVTMISKGTIKCFIMLSDHRYRCGQLFLVRNF
jgi:hypothetical protein